MVLAIFENRDGFEFIDKMYMGKKAKWRASRDHRDIAKFRKAMSIIKNGYTMNYSKI